MQHQVEIGLEPISVDRRVVMVHVLPVGERGYQGEAARAFEEHVLEVHPVRHTADGEEACVLTLRQVHAARLLMMP